MAKWVKYRRRGGQAPDPIPLVSLRRSAIALNVHFIATADLENMLFVVIFVDPEMFRLGFQFHTAAKDDDVIALTSDGGSARKGRGRSIQVAGLMQEHPWLAAIAKNEDPRLRRFEPKWIGTDSMWVVWMCPSFEHRVSDRSDIPSQTRGIYRYKRGDEIVYIGRGQVRSRLRAPEREDWDFETIEYSLVADDAQAKWESFWLDHFVEQNGKLPVYNRISGQRVPE